MSRCSVGLRQTRLNFHSLTNLPLNYSLPAQAAPQSNAPSMSPDLLHVNTLVVGNGPSALILSYILHGHIPYYDAVTYGPHPDPRLHDLLLPYSAKSKSQPSSQSLLDAVTDKAVIDYMQNVHSFFSADVLPVNLLLDTLIAEDELSFIDLSEKRSRVCWEFTRARAVSHLVVGSASRPGGQWESFVVDGEDDLALSYSEMLSLPGYPFTQWYKDTYGSGVEVPLRPRRADVALYYARYPSVVDIDATVRSNCVVSRVTRIQPRGFLVEYSSSSSPLSSTRVLCDNLVLASGIFESPLTTRDLPRSRSSSPFNDLHTSQLARSTPDITPQWTESPCSSVSSSCSLSMTCSSQTSCDIDADHADPVLVIGTGVSAADAINRTPRVIHIYKWHNDKGAPCSFRKFPKELYGEYVKVFERMRAAVARADHVDTNSAYVGLPNAQLLEFNPKTHTADIQLANGSVMTLKVSCVMQYTGRSSSLAFLDALVVPDLDTTSITKLTIRSQYKNTLPEIAPNVYAMGSLTGDSLVRFLLGSSVWVASHLGI